MLQRRKVCFLLTSVKQQKSLERLLTYVMIVSNWQVAWSVVLL